jgi:two-component system, NtrC family, sensor histidine kinase GlrK
MRRVLSFSIFLKFFLAFLFLGIFPFIIAVLFLIAGYESVVLELLSQLEGTQNIQQSEDTASLLTTLRFQALLTTLLLILLITGGSVILGRIFSIPFQTLLSGVREIQKGNYHIRLPLRSSDEIGQLSSQFNEIAERLDEISRRETALSRNKNDFISVVAHQLRTPTSAVKWAIRLVLDEDETEKNLNKEQRWTLQRGYLANEQMIRLISDLLDVSRIEEGRFGYQFEHLDILPLLEANINNFRMLAREKDITIQISTASKTLPKVYVDKKRLTLALVNILSNSLHYTPQGGSITLEPKVLKSTEELLITVKDTGIGISKEEKQKIFSKFFRGTKAKLMHTEGSGLGLFIVRNVVEKHGGKIWIESEKNKGTSITFTLPLNKEALPKKQDSVHEFLSNI